MNLEMDPAAEMPGIFRNRLVSDSFNDFSRFDALRADVDMTHRAVLDRFYALDVRTPDLAGFVVCVGNVVSEAGTFVANRALCHSRLHRFNRKLLT